MKKFWEISTNKTAAELLGWLLVTDVLIWLVDSAGWWPLRVGLFVSLVFLPGVALLRALRITLKTISAGVLYSFGLSVLVLMVSGLVTNQALMMVGISRPLELPGIAIIWTLVTAAIIVAGVFTNPQPAKLRRWSLAGVSNLAWMFGFLTLLLPGLAALGAIRLNNGGDALVAQATLGYAAILIVYAFVLRRRLPDGLLAWFIFVMGLSILLMTSLRGWDILGHDIEREFRVYTLAHLNGRWDIGLNRDPYNACLSITILPEMFAKLLGVSGLLVFKLILQIVFAACPAVLYVLLRQYVSRLGALAGCMLFISYPTFVNDSAMLTRQGVAYLFFALALLVISNKTQKKRYRRLFLLCALGAVLSHYSTAYMFVALFAGAVVCKYVVGWWQKRRSPQYRTPRSVVSPLYAGLILLMTFIWYTQITATSNGLLTTIRSSIANIPKLMTEDNKSSDTSVALVFSGSKSVVDLYQTYIKTSQGGAAAHEAGPAEPMPLLTSDDLPLTWLGKKAQSMGLNPSIITTLRQNFAKFLQLLALAGVLYAVYVLLRKRPDALGIDTLFRKRPDTLTIDFICLSMAGIVLLALMVVLPVLSVNYGVLRAFQQALIFLVLPITLLLAQLHRPLRAWMRTSIATIGVVGLFFLFTGMFAQMLGGTSPSLSLNNRGLYFGLYYSSAADYESFVWLKTHVPKGGDVRAANFNRAVMHDPEYPFGHTGILPSQLKPKSYVYLDYAQIVSQKFYAYYESSPLVMTFPVGYYDTTKNQIYSTSSTRVYQ
ncbi:MAG TPA: DUF2206 domain-containing protein [Candidatus Saccharimonadia bacterium]|nr:DUF2206 domain-containing protein [Candidatus Saccharimonadia bacterium]